MRLLAALLLIAAPALPAPAGVPEVAVLADNAAPPLPTPAVPPLLVLSLGPEVGERRVSYRDRVSTGLAAYQSGAIGLFKLAAELYPARGKGLPVVSDVGFLGSTSRSLRAQAQFAPGTSFDDQWHLWDVGARWRAMFGGEERGGLSLRYGSVSSNISGPQLYNVLLPTGTLQYWRPGLDLRFPIGPVSLSVSGGYLDVVVQDSIGHAFPRSTDAGFDAGARLELRLGQHMVLHIAGKYTRFFYSLHPQPNDPFVAGGALDEYAVVEIGFSLRV